MKKVAGRLRLDLAQFRELEAFAAFGSDLDKASKAQLERGSRLVELLKQPQYAPYAMERAVVSVWAGTTGQLDDVPLEDVKRFESEFLDYVGHENPGLYAAIRESGDLSDDSVAGLEKTVDAFKRTFMTSEGHLLVKDLPVEAMSEEEIKVATVTRQVRG
jgi:F-type H+-transporting ATPase subunit alpha